MNNSQNSPASNTEPKPAEAIARGHHDVRPIDEWLRDRLTGKHDVETTLSMFRRKLAERDQRAAAIQRGDGQTDVRSADDWLKEYPGLVVMDPDGWDRSNYEASWAERITRNEFEKRVAESTCKYPAGFFDKFATPPAAKPECCTESEWQEHLASGAHASAKPNETSGATLSDVFYQWAGRDGSINLQAYQAEIFLRELNAVRKSAGAEEGCQYCGNTGMVSWTAGGTTRLDPCGCQLTAERTAGAVAKSTPGVDAVELIAKERARQVSQEGWTPEHDDEHRSMEMIDAAVCYAEAAELQCCGVPKSSIDDTPDGWPWDYQWWKPSEDPVRNLVKAGALIAAEIDRQLRANRTAPRTAAREAFHEVIPDAAGGGK